MDNNFSDYNLYTAGFIAIGKYISGMPSFVRPNNKFFIQLISAKACLCAKSVLNKVTSRVYEC